MSSYNGYGETRSARIDMPDAQELGGKNPAMPSFVRAPFYPTAPFYSTNPNVGYQTRFYGCTLVSTDADYNVGTEAIRRVQFDIPCRLIAINGSAQIVGGGVPTNAFTGHDPRDLFLFRMEYTTGDQLTTAARLASTVVGTNEGNQGEIGGTGYTINSGASLVVGLTPLFINLRIDITLVCLEMRGPSNYNRV